MVSSLPPCRPERRWRHPKESLQGFYLLAESNEKLNLSRQRPWLNTKRFSTAGALCNAGKLVKRAKRERDRSVATDAVNLKSFLHLQYILSFSFFQSLCRK